MTSHAVKLHPLGFYQLDPIPSEDTLNEFYQSHYYDLLSRGGRAPEIRKLLDSAGERNEELDWLSATLYVDVADTIRAHAPDSGDVLDVGCGAGDLVAWLAGEGFAASGLDPSIDAVAAATARGVDAECSTLEGWSVQARNAGKYRAITLMNVLEHVPDPIAVLDSLKAMLAPGGVLVFRVPNDFTDLQAAAEESGVQRKQWWVAEPDHINYFRAESARAACADVGLDVVEVTSDFPMEFFLLMGLNYIDDPGKGSESHQLRRTLEMNMPKAMRQGLYRNFAAQGMGRNILVTARRP